MIKKKIAILGSTSSIGKSLLDIIKKDQKKFKIELLTANTNYKDLINQAKKFNVKNLIITDPDSFKKAKIILKKKKILNFFDNIYGSPKKKVQHIKLIKRNNKMTIFIGDSIDDFYSAKSTNIKFLLKINSENKLFTF